MKTQIILASCLLVLACTPWDRSYYKPLSTGAYSSNICGRDAPNNVIGIEQNEGVFIFVTLDSPDKENIVAPRISIYVPTKVTVSLVTDKIDVNDSQSSPDYAAQITKIQKLVTDESGPYGASLAYLNPTDLLPGYTNNSFHMGGQIKHGYEWYYLIIDGIIGTPSSVLTLTLPDMMINGKRFHSEPLRFERSNYVQHFCG